MNIVGRDQVVQLTSEHEVISKAIETIKAFEGYMRSLAHMRGDIRYLRIAALSNQMQQKFVMVAHQRMRSN